MYASRADPDSAQAYAGRVLQLLGMDAGTGERYVQACGEVMTSPTVEVGRTCLEGFTRVAPDEPMFPILVFAELQQTDSLFARIDQGIRQRKEYLVLLLRHVERVAGSDPRFDEVRRRMGVQ